MPLDLWQWFNLILFKVKIYFSISLNINVTLPQKQSWFNKDRQCPGHCYTLRPRWTVFVGLSPREAGEGGGGESDGLGLFLTFFF